LFDVPFISSKLVLLLAVGVAYNIAAAILAGSTPLFATAIAHYSPFFGPGIFLSTLAMTTFLSLLWNLKLFSLPLSANLEEELEMQQQSASDPHVRGSSFGSAARTLRTKAQQGIDKLKTGRRLGKRSRAAYAKIGGSSQNHRPSI